MYVCSSFSVGKAGSCREGRREQASRGCLGMEQRREAGRDRVGVDGRSFGRKAAEASGRVARAVMQLKQFVPTMATCIRHNKVRILIGDPIWES